MLCFLFFVFFSSRRRHTRLQGDWSSDVCSSDLGVVWAGAAVANAKAEARKQRERTVTIAAEIMADSTAHAEITTRPDADEPRNLRAAGLRRSFLGFAVSRPPLLRGFPYGFQTGRRHLPLLGLWLGRLRLSLFQRRPSRSLCGGDPGAAGLADCAALLRTHVIRFGRGGYRGLW